MMPELNIKIPACPQGGYPIRIGTDILGSLWDKIEADFGKYSKFVVTDENLGDMTGLEFIKTVITQKPMVNCAAVSALLPEDFHEASEGLGILMQLPVRPGPEYAKELVEHLKSILDLGIETS